MYLARCALDSFTLSCDGWIGVIHPDAEMQTAGDPVWAHKDAEELQCLHQVRG